MSRSLLSSTNRCVVFLFVLVLACSALAVAQKQASLYRFQGDADGWNPIGFLIADKTGNLYGTTTYGGSSACDLYGCGTVFQLQRPAKPGDPWTKNTIYTFAGSPDGLWPSAGHMVFDKAGNLYGTTQYGGNAPFGYGTVFQLTPPAEPGGSWIETILYNFTDGDDGGVPANGLVQDAAGNLYGTTNDGGQYGMQAGVGTIFQLAPPAVKGGAWTETTLHSFRLIRDGDEPNGLILDAKGNLYGSRSADNITCNPVHAKHCGTVFELERQPTGWHMKVLHQFEGGDGSSPNGIIFGADGNLYGTTSGFGGDTTTGGTVFELSPPPDRDGPWTETLLYIFSGYADGSSPSSEPTLDAKGNLYGTTFYGGDGACNFGLGCGVVFALAPPPESGSPWTETVLYTFKGGHDGADPFAGLIWGPGGRLYGTAAEGGGSASCNGGCGTAFEVRR